MSITFARGRCGRPFTVVDKMGRCKPCGVVLSMSVMALIGCGQANNRTTLERIISARVVLNQELAVLLAGVNDTDSARSRSAVVAGKLQAITANLKRLKSTEGHMNDVEALKRKYQGPQLEAERQVVGHIKRILADPEAWEALAIDDALKELAIEEGSLPGHADGQDAAAPAVPPVDSPHPTAGPSQARSKLDRVETTTREPQGRANVDGTN